MPSSTSTPHVPDLLTVEEAARVLRIGRTKAYALTQVWRDSGGEIGIPVIEVGGLRVPKARLEEIIGAPILSLPAKEPAPTEPATPGTPELRSIDGDLADASPTQNAADVTQAALPFSA